MQGDHRGEETEVLLRRRDVLDRLCRSPAHVRDLVEETGQSRRTINRAVNELEDAGFVERGENGIQATTAGRLARDRLAGFLSDLDDVLTAEAVLDPVPTSTGIAPEVVAGGESILAAGPASYRPLERFHEDLTDTERYRALVPSLDDPRTIRLLYEHVLTRGRPAELVVSPEVFETLREEFPRRMAAMAREEGFSVHVGEVPPFGLGLFEHDSSGSEPTTRVHLVVLDENGTVHGSIVNDAAGAVEWAKLQYETARSGATDRTDALIGDADGGVVGVTEGYHGTIGQSLPVSLEREGFTEIDVSYFGDQPVEDPETAWRAGISLAEVHTGYAIQRPTLDEADPSGPDESGDDFSGEGELASALTASLAAGSDCIVLGPPGSGKSTICKQVACAWYEDDRGRVLYRQSDRGRPFSSVDALVEAARGGDGHTLVVVEDAVRPTASAVFEAVDRLAGHDDVSVLLDARDHEWADREKLATEVTDLELFYVPPLDETDCERLVRQFERTTDREVEVSAEQLWAAVQDEASTTEKGSPNEMLRLVHRLATYADPLSDGPTALEDAAGSVYEDLADDDLALSVCVLANALNVAGIGVDRGLLYAVADAQEFAVADEATAFDAVDDALDRLEGRVLFSRKDGRYRTVHEEWSATFLAHLVDAEGETAAARRFGATVSAVLALADDPGRRERIGNHLRRDGASIASGAWRDDSEAWRDDSEVWRDDPGEWADEIVNAVYAAGCERPKLAPLFGDGTEDSIVLPAGCSEAVDDERTIRLGELLLAAGFYDRAKRAFDRLAGRGEDAEAERLLGLARIENERGNVDEALTHARKCLSATENRERPLLGARARLELATALTSKGELADAETACEAVLETFRERGYERMLSKTLGQIGGIATRRCEYDRAQAYFEERLELARALGDRMEEADALNTLAWVPYRKGEFDEAIHLYEGSLEIRRSLGDRPGVATLMLNLGMIHNARGDLDPARKFLERSLEMNAELGDRHDVAKTLQSLGIVHQRERELDRARDCFERCLDAFEDVGDRYAVGRHLPNVGQINLIDGNYDRAEEALQRCVEINRELGDRHCEARGHYNLGLVAVERGEFDEAERTLERASELFGEQGDHSAQGNASSYLGTVALRRGELGRAAERLEHSRELMEAGEELDEELRTLNELGTLARMRGDDERARQLHERVIEEDEFDEFARAHCGLAEIALRDGDLASAREHVDAALAVIDQVAAGVRFQIELAGSSVASAEGSLDDAEDRARGVLETAEAAGARYWVGRSHRSLGAVARDADEPERALERWTDALETFEAIEAYPDALGTVDSILALVAAEESENETSGEEWRARSARLRSHTPETFREAARKEATARSGVEL